MASRRKTPARRPPRRNAPIPRNRVARGGAAPVRAVAPVVRQNRAANRALLGPQKTTVQLDAGLAGRPTVVDLISPNVPDQTGYSGRNYIDLGIDREFFNPQPSVDRGGNIYTLASLSAAHINGMRAVVAA